MSDRVAGSEMAGDADAPKAMAATHTRRPLLKFAPIVVVAAGLAFGYAMGWHRYLTLDYLAESRETLMGFATAHPVLAPAGFFVVYLLAVAFSFPAASILTIFAGFLFGWLLGGVLVVFAATIGASLLFLAAKSAVGGLLKDRVGGKLAKLSCGFEHNAFSYLLILRLAPIFPFFAVNIAPACCGVKLKTFVAATFLGILPGTFAYAYLGEGVDSVIAAAQAAGAEIELSDLVTPKISIAFAVLALVAAIAVVVKRLRAHHPS